MSNESGELRTVAWNEVFPWLMIFRALSLSISLPILFVATIGTLLVPLGWWGAEQILSDADRDQLAKIHYAAPDTFVNSSTGAGRLALRGKTPADWRAWIEPILEVPRQAIVPSLYMFRADATWSQLAYLGLGSLWNLLVWAFFGGVMTRVAVVKLGRQEREGLVDASRFVIRRLLAFFGAPLFPLVGVLVVVILVYPVGLLLRWDVGVFVASLIWPFVLLGGAIVTFLIVGLVIGWPLMWGATSAEDMGDVYEAAQRSYSYALGRPLHYAFYGLVALIVGSIAYMAVTYVAHLVVFFSHCIVSRGPGAGAMFMTVSDYSLAGGPGRLIILCLDSVVLIAGYAFRFGFFWCAAGAIYLLLRRDSDQIEYDDVVVQGRQRRYSLPPLVTNEAGVPGVADQES